MLAQQNAKHRSRLEHWTYIQSTEHRAQFKLLLLFQIFLIVLLLFHLLPQFHFDADDRTSLSSVRNICWMLRPSDNCSCCRFCYIRNASCLFSFTLLTMLLAAQIKCILNDKWDDTKTPPILPNETNDNRQWFNEWMNHWEKKLKLKTFTMRRKKKNVHEREKTSCICSIFHLVFIIFLSVFVFVRNLGFFFVFIRVGN